MPKVGRAHKSRCISGIILHLMVIPSISANARAIAFQVAQPGARLEIAVAPIQPLRMCERLTDTNHTIKRCHFVTHVCVKLRNAGQVLDAHMGSHRPRGLPSSMSSRILRRQGSINLDGHVSPAFACWDHHALLDEHVVQVCKGPVRFLAASPWFQVVWFH